MCIVIWDSNPHNLFSRCYIYYLVQILTDFEYLKILFRFQAFNIYHFCVAAENAFCPKDVPGS